MHIAVSVELAEFRQRVQAHIATKKPPLTRLPGTRSPERDDLPVYRDWCASLFSENFVGFDWPADWGGLGLSDPLREMILDDELAKAQLPRPLGAWNLVCGALFAFGSDDQKTKYLPRIRSFEDFWCQLFSEPEAGSDLASLRTNAELVDGEWVINGQKVWTTHGHLAELGFLLARTDRDVPKHHGISAFIVDMSLPGITVRPLREMTGSSDFNEVFFENVRLPADAIIGEPGQGWAITRAALAHERSQNQREDSLLDKIRRLVDIAATRSALDDAAIDREDVRQQLGSLYARSRALELMGYENTLRSAAGVGHVRDAPTAKLLYTDANLDAVTFALDLLGPRGALGEGDPEVVDAGYWQNAFLFARGYTIAGGTNEVMRNLIAERGLGLPR